LSILASIKKGVQALLPVLRIGLLRKSFIYLSASILNALIPFLLLPLIARALGPANYGVVGTYTALVTGAALFIGLNTQGILGPIYFKGDREEFAEALRACLVVLWITTPCVALAFFLGGRFVESFSGVSAGWQFTVVGAAAGNFALSVALAVCQVRGMAMRFGLLQIAYSVVNIGLACGLILGLHWGWQGRALSQLCASLGVGFGGMVAFGNEYGLLKRPSVKMIREALRFGIPLVPHILATILRNSFDRIFIAAAAGTIAAGKYFIAYQIATVLTLVCSAVNQAWSPWLFQKLSTGKPEDRAEIKRVTYIVLAFFCLATVLLMTIGPYLVSVLAGGRFGNAGDLIVILAPASGLNGAYYLFTNYIFYSQRTEWLAIITVATAAIQTALTVAFVRGFGAAGAAYASLFGGIIYFSATWIAAERLVPMGWFDRRVYAQPKDAQAGGETRERAE